MTTSGGRRGRWTPQFVVCGSLLAVALMTTGCTYAARLYDIQAGGSPIAAKFKWSGSGKGKVEMTLPSGEVLVGEYVTVADDTMTWGLVFIAGATVNGYAVTTQGKQRGTAIVTGTQGTTIQCEYVTSAVSPSGYGSCRDNRGKIYKLMF
ncbi:MAG: hypothetical protein ONB15_06100 [candidate division KSB1 bacterium]|nr:hypothetical protein [candidate division KSB1 bacterium]